jgi:hypothetical protein
MAMKPVAPRELAHLDVEDAIEHDLRVLHAQRDIPAWMNED